MLLAVKAPPVRSETQSGFIPAFDFLRASMMLLGVATHTAFSYSRLVDVRWQWYFQDAKAASLPTAAVLFVHLFRMPLFFVMAGFFAALLWERGPRTFFFNRLKRVALPLVLGWLILFPLVILAVDFAKYNQGQGILWGHPRTFSSLLDRENWPSLGPIHLWFLYYLLVFYIIAGLLSLMRRALPRGPEKRSWRAKFTSSATPTILWLQLALVTGVLGATHTKIIYTPSSFIIEWKYPVFYAVFFFSGWMMFSKKESLSELNSDWPLTLPLGVLSGVIFVAIEMGYLTTPSSLQILCLALATCLMVHGLIGISLKFYQSMNRWVRYLSQASYWIYLIHVPLVYASAGLLARVSAPWPVKFTCVFAIALFLSLLSYQLLQWALHSPSSQKQAE